MIDVIANRYAEALFQLSEEENITKEIYNELHDVVELIKNNKELDNVLKSPLVAKNEKTQLIEALFNNKINNDLKNFLKILVEKGRISSLKSIELTFKELLNDKHNIIEGTVISAIALTEKQVKELEEKLSKKYNKNVTLENEVDQSILGGVLVRLGNTQIDGSVKTRLNNIKDQLTQVIS
nr:F0F1 ATP synthase subunit delta [uncultured Terrisporobacter sp.]